MKEVLCNTSAPESEQVFGSGTFPFASVQGVKMPGEIHCVGNLLFQSTDTTAAADRGSLMHEVLSFSFRVQLGVAGCGTELACRERKQVQ